jgi:hypothetical protein
MVRAVVAAGASAVGNVHLVHLLAATMPAAAAAGVRAEYDAMDVERTAD